MNVLSKMAELYISAEELIKDQEKITAEDIAAIYNYPDDEESMREIARRYSKVNLDHLSRAYYDAIKIIRERKYPQVNGVKYYPDFVNSLDFLSQDKKVALDNRLYKYGHRLLKFYPDDLYYFNKDGLDTRDEGELILSKDESKKVFELLVTKGFANMNFDIVCENCALPIIRVQFSDKDTKNSLEEFTEILIKKVDLYCHSCDEDLEEEFGLSHFKESIKRNLNYYFENKNVEFYEISMIDFPSREISDL